MVAWKFVDVFKMLSLQTDTPRLVKVVDEAFSTECILDEVVKRALRIHTHLHNLICV